MVVINLIVKMAPGKPLTAEERNIIVKVISRGITHDAVARKLDRSVRTVLRYLENPAPGKARSDKSVSGRWRQRVNVDSCIIHAWLARPANGGARNLANSYPDPKKSLRNTRTWGHIGMKVYTVGYEASTIHRWITSNFVWPIQLGKSWVFKIDKNYFMFRRQRGGGCLMI